MLCYLVASRYAQVYATFSYEGGDIGSGKEDECEGKVLYKRDVKTRVSVELNV